MVPKLAADPGRSSLRIPPMGAANSEELELPPRENCCWVRTLGLPIAFVARDRKGTGAGQPDSLGAARRPGKYLCPLSKAHQNARAANGTGGEDGPTRAAVGPTSIPPLALRSRGL